MMKGIDVSKHNGVINWKSLKNEGVEFAIIRAGFGKTSKQKDDKFEANYLGCKQNGIPCGVYWYSYAKDAAEALEEAKACYEVLKYKHFELPIFIDMEESCTAKHAADIVKTFCDYLEGFHYYTGVYSGKYFIGDNMPGITERYCGWIAQWATKCTYNGPFKLWQYSDNGRFAGISGPVDLDYLFDESLITTIVEGGYNGYTQKTESIDSVTVEKKKVITISVDGKEKYKFEV